MPPTEKEIECAIDEEVVECSEMDKPFTGVPAPVVLSDDPWFGPAVISDKGQDYMEKEAEIKQQEEENVSTGQKSLITFMRQCIRWQPRVVPQLFTLIQLVDQRTSRVVLKIFIDDMQCVMI